MRLTHDEMCAAVKAWLDRQLLGDAPKVIKVRQSRDRQSFHVVFAQ